MWFSLTETYWWSGCTSSSLSLTYFFVWKIFYNFNTAFDYLLMLTIFHVKMFLSFLTDIYVIFLYWNILIKWRHFIFICHLLPLIIYWCWLFFMCKMFLLFLTDVYLIFCYWNISMKWMHFIFICYLLMLICCITAFDNLLMLTIFHVQNVLIIVDWCLCDFLVLKYIDEVDALHFCLLIIDVDMLHSRFDNLLMLTIFHVQNVLIIVDWCLCDFLLLKHIDEVDALHLHLSFTAFDYLLMLTIFHVQNVLIILDWCLCDFLFLKHIDEVDALHFHLSLTYFLCGNYSTISILLLIIY